MKTKKTIFLLVTLLFLAANFVSAADDGNRYFVKSTSTFWKKSFGVRNGFDNGFTTELSDWQLRVAKIFGVETEPVRKLNILPGLVQAAVSGKQTTSQRQVPADKIPWGIKAVYNDQLLTKTSGGLGVNVAVLDTGVNKLHPDLKNRVKDCKDFSSPIPLVNGKCDDKNGHGTHMAGIIAADGGSDGQGISGIAPEANLFAYKVCSTDGTCWADDVAAGIRAAADNGADIINLSLGSDMPSGFIASATAYAVSKDVLVIAAGGNDGPYQGSIDYPAADPTVVGVGALDVNSQIPDWSARGVNSTDTPYVSENQDMEFAAPGVNIESTWKDGGYAILSGTSMAAPHVAGLAAKLWQKDALNPASATRELLRKLSNDVLPAGDDDASGWGMPRL